MASGPVLDLARDAERVLAAGWLEPGERILEWTPSWKLPAAEGIPKPPWPSLPKRIAEVAGLVLLWIAGSVVVLVLFLLLADGLSGGEDGSGKRARGPAVVLHGKGSGSAMGRLAVPGLRRRGWWVFTNRRIAFVAPDARSHAKFWSGSGPETELDGPVPLDTVLQVREGGYTCDEAHRTRTTRILRRTKPAGLYRRILFGDGSGIDLRRRHQ